MIPYFYKGETEGDKRVPAASFLELYPVSDSEPRPLVLVVPGGGYHHLASHEGKDVAEWLNEKGMHAAVFYYQLQPLDVDLLLSQLNTFLEDVKTKQKIADLLISTVGIIGFSAGGHLTALASTKNEQKPDFTILSYPVITLEEPYLHLGSRTQILGENPKAAERNAYSPDKWVTAETPPVFLWHTVNDQSVPVENSLEFAKQLRKYQVPFELHLFSDGRHGLGLANENPEVSQWTALLQSWLKKMNG